jgi:hypothetical protein
MQLRYRYTTKINGEAVLIIQAPSEITEPHLIKLLQDAIDEIKRATP